MRQARIPFFLALVVVTSWLVASVRGSGFTGGGGGSGSSGGWTRTGTTLSPTTAGDAVSVPGAGANSEKFGASAATAGGRCVAVGYQASANAADGTAIGYQAIASGFAGITVVGASASANTADSTAIGQQATVQSPGTGTAIGRGAFITGTECVVVGRAADSTNNSCIVLGAAATSTAANQFVVGSSTAPVNEAVIVDSGSGTRIAPTNGLAIKVRVVTKTANYTATTADHVIRVDATSGSVTITLPAASNAGALLRIKRIDGSANTVTVQRAGSDTIDGATSFTLTQYQSRDLVAPNTGADWGVY